LIVKSSARGKHACSNNAGASKHAAHGSGTALRSPPKGAVLPADP